MKGIWKMVLSSCTHKNLCTWWSHDRILLQKRFYHSIQITWILRRNRWIYSLNNLLIKTIHIIGSKRRIQSAQLIQNTSNWPYIRFRIIRLIFPDLRTSIIRCSSLCLEHSTFGNFRNIQISKLHNSFLSQE